ncbi:MAG: galactokinase [Fusobacteriaceae bacterium]
MKEKLFNSFNEILGNQSKNLELFFSPGRVNLIGEHIDYNGGYVFPCALDFGTYAVVAKREDRKFRMYSLNFEKVGIVEFDLDLLENNPAHNWVNYPKGVLKMILDMGYKIETGLDILVFGNIPNGAGLSSSASLEVLMGTILRDEYNLEIDMIEIVKLSQKAENQFIGVNCGIMDQFAVGMGKKDNAILLNCDTLEYKYAPLVLDGASIVISNTNKQRGLADSKYNERRTSCEDAVADLQETGVEIKYLCELDIKQFDKVKDKIKSEESLTRARHAVTENMRVLDAVEKLNAGDLAGFGKLMNESHVSLKNDYEVTGIELDSLVEASWEAPGVIGARMTGAGFGGCTVALVKDECIDEFIEYVGKKYTETTKLKAHFYVAKVGDGARKL